MPNAKSVLRSLGRAMNPREAIESLVAEHGRGTTRWLAEELGVSMRTVQRWRKGTQAPRDSQRVTGLADAQQVRVNALRSARTVSVGAVSVISRSSGAPDGGRNVGTVGADFNIAADLLEQGASEDEVQAAISDAVMDGYGGNGFGEVLEIDDYGSFDIT
ncbi:MULTISPECIES: hypothetical protein [unclassified Pseudonocardia]|uniref:hypothetical protein n=1 Tax=unclassified Pseudonocardia TaxID=2619320 RepID=UPI00094ACDE0|nr:MULTISPECIES: hypothetical protein [unclassified Pseudonocardia]